jgi:succinoglycan biosynthesis transport protein ExoP
MGQVGGSWGTDGRDRKELGPELPKWQAGTSTYSRGHQSPDGDFQISFRHYVELLVRRRRIVVASLLACLVVSIIYAWGATPLYRSVAALEFEEKKAKFDDRLYGSPEYDQYKPYLATQMEVLKSRSLAEALVAKMNLSVPPPGWISYLIGLPFRLFSSDSSVDKDAARLNQLADSVLNRVTVKPVKTSNLVSVTFDAPAPKKAQEMLKVYLAEFLQTNLEKRRLESMEASKWLKEEVTKAERQLMESRAALVEFVVDNGIVSKDDSGHSGLGMVAELMNKTMEGHLRSQEARLRIEALSKSPGNGAEPVLPKDYSSEYVGKLKEQLAIQEAEYTQMKGLYSANYPKMTMIKDKIKFLTQRIAEIERTVVTAALETAKSEEGLFKKTFEKAKGEAERVKSLEAQHAVLQKEVETNTEFHKMLLKEFKEQEIKSRTIANNVRIIDAPSLPHRPFWPKKSLIILVGSFLGLCGGIGLAIMIDRLDDSVQSLREIEEDFGVPCLTDVPDYGDTKLLEQASDVPEKPEFMAKCNPRSIMADAIRNLHTSVFLGNQSNEVRCMAISSPTPSQGKTFIAVSTATILSSERDRVVIIDADMRKPRMHKVFGETEPGPGLSDLLLDESKPISEVTHASQFPGLSYIMCGTPVDNPVDIIRVGRMRRLIEKLKDNFEYVVFDTPPLLGFADTQMISLHTEGIVLVAREGNVARQDLREAIALVSKLNGCRLLGVVYNQTRGPVGGKYYGMGGSRYYYHGYRSYYNRDS